VSAAGDFNGDGYNDVMMRTDNADGSHDVNIVFGAGVNGSLTGTGLASHTINQLNVAGDMRGLDIHWSGSNTNITVGDTITSAGDFNGDGYDDVAIDVKTFHSGASAYYDHTLFVVYGHDSTTTMDLSTLMNGNGGAAYKITYQTPDDSHLSVTSAGDINGDGFDDLLIGNSSASENTGSTVHDGEAYVVYGGDYNNGVYGTISEAHINTTATQTAAAGGSYVGDTQNNTLLSGVTAVSFNAGLGNDVLNLTGTGLNTTPKNFIENTAIRQFDGGLGNDTILLDFSKETSGGENIDNANTLNADTIDFTGLNTAGGSAFVGSKITGVENFTFDTGSYNDTLKLDIKDVISMMSTSDSSPFGAHTLSIIQMEDLAASGHSSQNNTLAIYNGSSAMSGTQLAAMGFTKDVNGDSVQDTVTLTQGGNHVGYVYTQVDTGFQLIVDSRLNNAATVVQ